MDIDVMVRQIANLNLVVFGHRHGIAAAAGALNARGEPLTGEDIEKLLSEAPSQFKLDSAPVDENAPSEEPQHGFHDAVARIEALEREMADLKEEIAAAKKLEALAAHYIDAQGDPAAAP